MKVQTLTRLGTDFIARRDCRADAVALGAWERWHRRQTVTERALRKQTLTRLWYEILPCAGGGTEGQLRPQPLCAGPLGHYICASIITGAAPTAQLHSSHLFSGTCRRTASVKGTGLEQTQRELNTLQPKLGNSRPREFP